MDTSSTLKKKQTTTYMFKIMMFIYVLDLLFGWAFKGKDNDY